MNLEEAKVLLDTCKRDELRDHAFGDTEVYWTKDGKEIAEGYFGSGTQSIVLDLEDDGSEFLGNDARELRKCGTLGNTERNDETGPDEYLEGVVMPGLTLEGVWNELTSTKEG